MSKLQDTKDASPWPVFLPSPSWCLSHLFFAQLLRLRENHFWITKVDEGCSHCPLQAVTWYPRAVIGAAHPHSRGTPAMLAGVLMGRQFRIHLFTFLKGLLNMVLLTQSCQLNLR